MYLNVHSQYSLRYGTMSIPALVEEAISSGVTQMVLSDINNSTGIMEFMRECNEKGIKPIAGMEFRKAKQLLYLGIARNKEGMKELNDFLTEHNLEQKPLPDTAPEFLNVYTVYPYGKHHGSLKTNEYLGIRHEQLNSLFGKDLRNIKEKLLCLQPVFINDKIEYRLHEYLRGIDLNVVLTEVTEADKCQKTDRFFPAGELEARFSRYPFILDNTRNLMNSCVMDYPKGRVNLNRRTFTGYKKNDRELLEKLALAGMEYRYGRSNKQALTKIKHELKVIYELDFCAYFLITWDIIRYSGSQGYYHVGRGSGANSIVAYCLKITDVDPIELDLYFERFLNAQRTSPPDFDIDYSWDEREDVQDYIFKRYGSQHTALLGTMSTFKDRSIIREIGKVMGLPKTEIDGFTDQTRAAINQNNTTFQKIVAIYERMANMPNQRSIHAGGVLITEEPITYYTALDLPPKGMATVQWDMYEAEKIGFDKYDILSQRGIGHIKMAVKLVEENQQRKIDIHQVKDFMNDPKVNFNLRTGNTKGCFYIESPAMIQLNRKLGCDSYRVLVAASSIIRPGVASSGMMAEYIRNHHHPDKVKYLHPVMEERLKDTYGVMVYQEDVIKICIHFAGMDGADADILRRGMSGKYRSKKEFERLVERFHEEAKKLGRPDHIVKEVWRQVSSFAGYSFSKAHSASFAVESYQSLYLKTYFPREFMVGVLNNYGGFYDRALYVQELQKCGGIVHLPCVNHSDSLVNISGADVYLGLVGIHGLNERFIELVPEERRTNGPYTGLEDLVKRTNIGLEQGIILIRVGALRFTHKSKKELLWEIHLLMGARTKPGNINTELFTIDAKNYALPVLVNTRLENAYHELELLGFPLSMTMFELLQTGYRGDIMANDLINHIGQTIRMVGQYVCEKTVHTKKNQRMWFGNFLDAEGNSFDTVHFPNHTPMYPFRGKGCYLILGKVVEEFGFASLEVLRFAKLPILPNPVIS
ncbi:DNA polymerase III subunit alpha [Mucilaginibacter achroorhodeus]|uniref:DNA-directed DNA polymerase n=1 Tax=Mucilaginibacter achroorhodeus TaxID=2599294 RepID=A0A563U5Y5_9SPHI|nr:DNA polymerase III subunit alpha [Mucilaginibacter achroorhodeus]TWR26767.1 DNA polymerase III subunit alpha [Mucilaginibacter achroorhodeus]